MCLHTCVSAHTWRMSSWVTVDQRWLVNPGGLFLLSVLAAQFQRGGGAGTWECCGRDNGHAGCGWKERRGSTYSRMLHTTSGKSGVFVLRQVGFRVCSTETGVVTGDCLRVGLTSQELRGRNGQVFRRHRCRVDSPSYNVTCFPFWIRYNSPLTLVSRHLGVISLVLLWAVWCVRVVLHLEQLRFTWLNQKDSWAHLNRPTCTSRYRHTVESLFECLKAIITNFL